MKEELFELLTECDTLQEFVNAAAARIHTPFWVMDHTYAILAVSANPDAMPYLETIWEGKTLLDHIKNWQECGLLEKIDRTSNVVRHEENGISLILGDVTVKGRKVGRVTFFSENGPDEEAAELVVKALSVYFHDAGNSLNTTVLQQAFLSLFEKEADADEAVGMMYEAGWNEKPEYRIAVLEQAEHTKEVLIGQMRQIAVRDPYMPIIIDNGRIVALESKGHRIAEATDSELFRIGYSMPFERIGSLDSYRKEAVFALRAGKGKEEEFSVHMKEYLSDVISKEIDPLCLVDLRIRKMAEYDREYGTRYGITVRVYLENGQNKQLTAERLGVHLNTVKYRLQNVETLFGLCIEEDVMALGTAILLSAL